MTGPFTADDARYMARALRLAERGLNTTTPNPRVGCVLVRDGKVVGEGWHEVAGGPHAEVVALRAAGSASRGATAYVTLEPCSHHGRTPPCADALVEAGVARVVVAMEDPNPQVAGRGLERLRQAGIQAEAGLMEQAAIGLNPGFIKRMRTGRPWVQTKLAMSLDGRTAMASGESKWITGEAARADVQRLRARSCAILTGSATVLADNPALTVRIEGARRQPLRVVADSRLRTPADALVLSQPGKTLIAIATAESSAVAGLREAGADVVALAGNDGRVDLPALMDELGRRGINELMVEAGPVLNGALLQAGLVDELVVYLAPKLMGDAARGAFRLPGLERMADVLQWEIADVRAVGRDWRLTARVTTTP